MNGQPLTAYHPQFGQVEYSVQEVSDDPETQVTTTIGLMCKHAADGAKTPIIQQQAADIAAGCGSGPSNQLEQVEAVWAAVRSRLTFQEDADTAAEFAEPGKPVVEALLLPQDIAAGNLMYGDCDDFSVYAACLLTALGIPCAFVTVAADPQAPNLFSHVYVAAYPAGAGRTPVDCSHGPYCGWETPHPFRLQEWPVGGGVLGGLLTFAALAAAGYYLYRKAA